MPRIAVILALAVCSQPVRRRRPARPKIVPATANIFGAGLGVAPHPGGGGGGVTPTVWRLPRGVARA